MSAASQHDIGAYVVVDLWRVRVGKHDELERSSRELATQFRSLPGILSVDFTRLTEDSDRYLAVFRYASLEACERLAATNELRESHLRPHDPWDLDSPVYRGRAIAD